MSLTRTMSATNAEAFDYLMKNVLKWDADAAGLKSLRGEGYSDIVDITTLEESEIEALTYEDNGTKKKLPMKHKKLLKRVLLYYHFEVKQRASGIFCK